MPARSAWRFPGLAVGYFSREIDRRKGILISLVLLAIPTALLAHAPDLTTFTLLRVAQGLCMAAAFTLTLAYLGEHYSAADSAERLRRLHHRQRRQQSHRPADLGGASPTISGSPRISISSPSLNLLGAVLVYFTVEKTKPHDMTWAPA